MVKGAPDGIYIQEWVQGVVSQAEWPWYVLVLKPDKAKKEYDVMQCIEINYINPEPAGGGESADERTLYNIRYWAYSNIA